MKYRVQIAAVTMLATAWATAAMGQDDPPVAVINGEALSKSLLDAYAESRPSNAQGPAVEELVLQDLLRREALAQDLQERPEVIALMDVAQRNVLANMAVKAFLEANTPTDDDLKKIYDEQYGSQTGGTQEFKARHILVESEDQGVALVEELDGGADFAELAKEHSTGPSGPNGGDLGWFSADAMVPAFAEAVRTMEAGAHSESPVQTQFGWHVILLEDVRTQEPPAFDTVKPQLAQQAQRMALAGYLQELREAANIEIK